MRLVKVLRNYFITGVVVFAPVAITGYVLWKGFRLLDGLLGDLVAHLLGRHIPGTGAVATLALITLLGMVAANVVGRQLIAVGDRLLSAIPFVRSVYSSVKQLIDAFAVQNRGVFQQSVLVEYPRKGAYRMGFIVHDRPAEALGVDRPELVAVFIPHSPNATSGFLVMVPRDECIPLGLSIEETFRIIVSGGVLMPRAEAKLMAPEPDGANRARAPREG